MVLRSAFPMSALFLLIEASLTALSVWLPHYLLVVLAPHARTQLAELPILIFVHAFPHIAVLAFVLTVVKGLAKIWWWRGSIADLEPGRGGSIAWGREPDWAVDARPFVLAAFGAALMISAFVSVAASDLAGPKDYLIGIVWFTAPIWLLLPLFGGEMFILKRLRAPLGLSTA